MSESEYESQSTQNTISIECCSEIKREVNKIYNQTISELHVTKCHLTVNTCMTKRNWTISYCIMFIRYLKISTSLLNKYILSLICFVRMPEIWDVMGKSIYKKLTSKTPCLMSMSGNLNIWSRYRGTNSCRWELGLWSEVTFATLLRLPGYLGYWILTKQGIFSQKNP